MIKTKKQMYLVIAAFALVLLLGTTTYAFFNYTRTGGPNTVKTGRIYFNTEEGTPISLNNLFPITVPQGGVTASTPGVGKIDIHVEGDTTYDEGVEYLISAVGVTGNGNNANNLPINIAVTYTPTSGQSIGTVDANYFTNRATTSTSIYKILAGSTISDGDPLVVGYIAPNTEIDGTLTILAYLDDANIAITDTYPEQTVRTVIEANFNGTTCTTVLTGAEVTSENAATYCASAQALQTALNGSGLTDTQKNAVVSAGLATEYTDGTTSTWVNNRTVFTTAEWNALQASGVSFKVRAVANEGRWVPVPATPTPAPTPEQGG